MNKKQKFTSANTSVNSQKVPALFHKVSWIEGTKNLDYGGGKYDTATVFLKKLGVQNYIYDPFNRTALENIRARSFAPYDTVTISNVLNVIKEQQMRHFIIQDALTLLKSNGIIYISIYEGNGSGCGAVSRKDCWQENRKIKTYLADLRIFNPKIFKNMIIITKER